VGVVDGDRVARWHGDRVTKKRGDGQPIMLRYRRGLKADADIHGRSTRAEMTVLLCARTHGFTIVAWAVRLAAPARASEMAVAPVGMCQCHAPNAPAQLELIYGTKTDS